MNARYCTSWAYHGDGGPMWANPIYQSDHDYVELGEFTYARGPETTDARGNPMHATASAKERLGEVREMMRRFVEHHTGVSSPPSGLLDAMMQEPASDTMSGETLRRMPGSITPARIDELLVEHPIRQGALF